MNRKTIVYSYDYELFLGLDSGVFSTTLEDPTNIILAWHLQNRVKAIFFVDTVYLMRQMEMAEHSDQAAKDWKSVCNQLQHIWQLGHDIFPHIHPSWLDAEYDKQAGVWRNSQYRYYRFAACEPGVRRRLFDGSVNILRKALELPNYVPEGYRAGGWCIQPFGAFREHFDRWGVLADFSVAPGAANSSPLASFDFAAAPEKTIYWFVSDVVVEAPGGKFAEIPISMLEMSKFESQISRIFGKILCRTGYGMSMGQGLGVSFASSPKSGGEHPDREIATLDGYAFNILKVPACIRHLKAHGVLHMCSHPKLVTRHAMSASTVMFKHARRKWDLNFEWRALL